MGEWGIYPKNFAIYCLFPREFRVFESDTDPDKKKGYLCGMKWKVTGVS